MEQTDLELVQTYLRGEEEAFPALIERYMKPLYNFVWRFTGDKDGAEDIVQDTFLKVWKYLRKFDEKQSFKTWIYAIAKHTALDWLKRKRPAAFSEFDREDGGNSIVDVLEDESPLPVDQFEASETEAFLEKALLRIPFDQRTVLLLRYAEGFTFEEISHVLHKPLNTVKSQYRRALITLKKELATLYAPKGSSQSY